ncbi:unnamed protein product [Lactuca saligna]|uniref:Uncharacterized protein n=1 Tax=Lactuca saligna TaxID=75948 RepID=A0AA35YQF7_LACSI|nr:unnamed protein product [Lactuca saligna]
MMRQVIGMIRHSESRILEKTDHADQTKELRINSFNLKYVGAVKELKNMQKEQHALFVMDNDYATLNKKVDIICDAVTKYVTLYESFRPQITQLSTTFNQQFG